MKTRNEKLDLLRQKQQQIFNSNVFGLSKPADSLQRFTSESSAEEVDIVSKKISLMQQPSDIVKRYESQSNPQQHNLAQTLQKSALLQKAPTKSPFKQLDALQFSQKQPRVKFSDQNDADTAEKIREIKLIKQAQNSYFMQSFRQPQTQSNQTHQKSQNQPQNQSHKINPNKNQSQTAADELLSLLEKPKLLIDKECQEQFYQTKQLNGDLKQIIQKLQLENRQLKKDFEVEKQELKLLQTELDLKNAKQTLLEQKIKKLEENCEDYQKILKNYKHVVEPAYCVFNVFSQSKGFEGLRLDSMLTVQALKKVQGEKDKHAVNQVCVQLSRLACTDLEAFQQLGEEGVFELYNRYSK